MTQLYRGEQILRGFDDDIRDFVAAEMRKKGVDIRVGAKVARARGGRPTAPIRVVLADGSALDADTVLYATGRVPNTAGLGLDAARRRARRQRRGASSTSATAPTCPASTPSATSSTASS